LELKAINYGKNCGKGINIQEINPPGDTKEPLQGLFYYSEIIFSCFSLKFNTSAGF